LIGADALHVISLGHQQGGDGASVGRRRRATADQLHAEADDAADAQGQNRAGDRRRAREQANSQGRADGEQRGLPHSPEIQPRGHSQDSNKEGRVRGNQFGRLSWGDRVECVRNLGRRAAGEPPRGKSGDHRGQYAGDQDFASRPQPAADHEKNDKERR
jgi:hypothetical protein